MSSPSNPQHEPTMEEILASIRKIISEDQPEGGAISLEPAPEQHAEPAAVEADVLELTEEIHEAAAPQAPAAAAPAPQAYVPAKANDIVFESVDEPVHHEPVATPSYDSDDLISPHASAAVGRAFDSLNRLSETPQVPRPSGSDVESVFTRAVQDSFEPLLHQWVAGHSGDIINQLKPIIREWMDENLPPLIEAAVEKEVRSRGRRR